MTAVLRLETMADSVPVPPLGRHLIVELYEATAIDCVAHVEAAFRDAALAAGATLLSVHMHRFLPQGVSGVAILSESHISIHSWPEHGYAALDVFMCGHADPHLAAASLKTSLGAARMTVHEIHRGLDPA